MAKKVNAITNLREIGQAVATNNIATPEFALTLAKAFDKEIELKTHNVSEIADLLMPILDYVSYRNSLYYNPEIPDGFSTYVTDTEGTRHIIPELDKLIPARFSRLTVPAAITWTGEDCYQNDLLNLLATKVTRTDYVLDYLVLDHSIKTLRQLIKKNDVKTILNSGSMPNLIQKFGDAPIKCGVNMIHSDKAFVPVSLNIRVHKLDAFTDPVNNFCFELFDSLFKS